MKLLNAEKRIWQWGNPTHILPAGGRILSWFDALRDPVQFISSLGLMLLSWAIAIIETYVILSQFVQGTALVVCPGVGNHCARNSHSLRSRFNWHLKPLEVASFSLFNVDASSALAYGITTHLLNITINGAFARAGEFRKIHFFKLDARPGAAADPGIHTEQTNA